MLNLFPEVLVFLFGEWFHGGRVPVVGVVAYSGAKPVGSGRTTASPSSENLEAGGSAGLSRTED
jgi:hypothetical protein